MARVYQAATMGEAHVRIAVAERGQADLLVHRVSSWGLARGDALWFVTRDKQEASVWAFFTGAGMAELKVAFVDSHAEAGWVRDHRWKGRLG